MTVKSYEVVCDSCGASAVNEDRARGTPEGWADINIGGRGPDGTSLSGMSHIKTLYAQLCPGCLDRPLGEVIAAVAKTMGQIYDTRAGTTA